jgi:hypothetical protein
MLSNIGFRRNRTPLALVIFWTTVGAAAFLMPGCQQDTSRSSLDYAARIRADRHSLEAREGDRIPIQLRLTNTGLCAWDSADTPPCFLSYHLLGADGSVVTFDNRRIPLPGRVEPAQTAKLEIQFRSPLQAGEYLLEFDLLREGAAWFKDAGSPTLMVKLKVAERRWPDSGQEIGLSYGGYTQWTSTSPEIDLIYKLIRLTLEQNETTFPGKSGRVSGFAPGTNYPQIWLRDANTILPASRYFYGADWLASWLEEHLFRQDENGSLQDWIDSQGEADKNTTETDQEASAVQAAYQIVSLLGRDWLLKEIRGRRIIDRLAAALTYVRQNRWTSEWGGLVTGAHTADWGDVDIVDSDQQAVYTDDRTHWTVDIYDQSMFYQACMNLALMLELVDDTSRSNLWKDTARKLAEGTRELLWQEEKGFFAMHNHLDELTHDSFEEKDIFAMGGNLQALLSGLASAAQARSILETALARQQALGISTISGTLLPPYPPGVFKHPLLDDPYEYQNGAQWDWFGGRLVLALFQHGYSQTARQKLCEIIQKNQANRGFFEWENREGTPVGSDMFCGSAGSLTQAVVAGYYGIQQDKNSFLLTLNLGTDSARIHLHQPADDSFIAYDYQFDQERGDIVLNIDASKAVRSPLRILNPWPSLSLENSSDHLNVLLDGRPVDFRLQELNSDIYIVVEAVKFRGREIRAALR